jgi:HEAT repeat protein
MLGETLSQASGFSGDIERAIVRGDMQYLLDALDDGSLEARIMAVEGLGELGGESARLALLRLARDRWGYRPEIRIAALRSLGKVTESGRYADLLGGFIARENRKVVAAARDMLRHVDPAGFAGRLLAQGCLDHAAIRVYGSSREEAAAGLLASFLDERMEAGDLSSPRQWGKVFAAVRALGNIKGPDSVQALQSLLAWLDDAERPQTTGLAGQRLDKIRQAARESLPQSGKG